MFKFLKNLIKGGNEVNNNPFFDEVEKIEKKEDPSVTIKDSLPIPIMSLAEVIRTQENLTTSKGPCGLGASFYIYRGGTEYFYFSVSITPLSGRNAGIYFGQITMYSFPVGPGEYRAIDEKQFDLKNEESIYLAKAIISRHDEDEQKKQHNARQEMEDVLQLALNKQGE